MKKNNKKLDILYKIKNGLIVSCQARKGWPMYGKEIMASFAEAAMIGGAVAIRANGTENIKEIKKRVDLPIIGINKIWYEKIPVYITPTYDSAVEVIEAGAEIVALDGTNRLRPNGETFEEIVKKLRVKYDNLLIMADIAKVEEALSAEKVGADLIATTLRGFTDDTHRKKDSPDFKLIKTLAKKVNLPIIAEGGISTPEQARKCIQCGAYAVVVGTAITRPEVITERFSEKLRMDVRY